MERKLLRFISALRSHEVRVSTAESLDAMRVLALIGYEQREQLKQALAMCLAKTQQEEQTCYHCFDLFYGSDIADKSPTLIESDTSDDQSPSIDLDIDALVAGDSRLHAAINAPLSQLLLEGQQAKLAAALARAAQDSQADQIQHFTQSGAKTRQLLKEAGLEENQRDIEELKAIDSPQAQHLAQLLSQKQQQFRQQARAHIDKAFLLTANREGRKLQENVLLRANLSSLEEKHFVEMKKLVGKIAKKLTARHSRKQSVKNRGRLDVAKTLRRNIQHDGILFETHWRKKSKEQPKVMALCDISGSVAAHAKFLLLFLYSLSDVLPEIRSFVFSNRLGEVSELFERMDAADAIESSFKTWGQGGSDYGRSLEDFNNLCLDKITNNTTVIILGDARSNKAEPRLDILQAVYQRAKTVLWLNPEPRTHWDTGDSEIRRYRSACHFVAECQSLKQLEGLVDQLLKRIN